MNITKIIVAAVALALPVAAHAETPMAKDMARLALEYKNVKCEETGVIEKDNKVLISCANGQAYAVLVMTGSDGKEFVSVQRFNQLTKTFYPI